MRHRMFAALSLALAGLAAPAAVAHAEDAPFIFSPVGPGAGHGAIGLGGKVHMVVPELYVPIPFFDFHYVRSFTENFDLRLSLNTLLVANYGDLGVRLHFGGPEFSFGLNASLTTFFVVFGGKDGGGGLASFAATPGAFVGFGSPTFQFSIGADVPLFFAAGAFANIGGDSAGTGLTGFKAMVRPSAAIEFPVSASTNLYIQGSAMIIPDVKFIVGPMLAIGASF